MNKSHIILGLDCSLGNCSVAVLADGKIVAKEFEEMQRGQAAALVPMIDSVLRQADLDYGDLTQIVVTNGPGSFTGVRIGLAAAHGLSVALGLPVAGLLSLDVLASQAPLDKDVVAIVVVRDDEAFVKLSEKNEPVVMGKEELEKALLQGECFVASHVKRPFESVEADLVVQLDAEMVVKLAFERLLKGSLLQEAQPVYLRAPDVTISSDSRKH